LHPRTHAPACTARSTAPKRQVASLSLVPEFSLSALRAEHQQLVRDVTVGASLVSRVLVLTRRPAALGADQRVLVSVSHATEATHTG
jgi:hypothetical protein